MERDKNTAVLLLQPCFGSIVFIVTSTFLKVFFAAADVSEELRADMWDMGNMIKHSKQMLVMRPFAVCFLKAFPWEKNGVKQGKCDS